MKLAQLTAGIEPNSSEPKPQIFTAEPISLTFCARVTTSQIFHKLIFCNAKLPNHSKKDQARQKLTYTIYNITITCAAFSLASCTCSLYLSSAASIWFILSFIALACNYINCNSYTLQMYNAQHIFSQQKYNMQY